MGQQWLVRRRAPNTNRTTANAREAVSVLDPSRTWELAPAGVMLLLSSPCWVLRCQKAPHAENISGQIMIVKISGSGLRRGPLESGSGLLVTNSHRIAFQLIPAACWECVSCVLCLGVLELTVCCATIDILFQGPLPAARWLAAVLPSVIFPNTVSNASSANSNQNSPGMAACPSLVPPSPGLALSSWDCSYVILVVIHARNSEDQRWLAPSASLFSLQHSLLPPTSNLQPRYQFSHTLSTATAWSTKIKTAPRSRAWVPGCPSQARPLPPGPPFNPTNLDPFLRTRTVPLTIARPAHAADLALAALLTRVRPIVR
ncbi:hypothetical protein F5882DRAFT_374501 [Hyaloscypha sp. PMI_1271]|nr:hypothetical protein F5882DRAFT_374501 [Hyaloscypha sp. PMI_1271]